MTPDIRNKYLTAKEVADALDVSYTSLMAMIRKGAPVHYWGMSGKRYRIVLDEIIAWMDQYGRDKIKARKAPKAAPKPPETTADMADRRRQLMEAIK